MHTTKLTNCLTSIVIFQYHLVSGNWIFIWVYTHRLQAMKSIEGVKNNPLRFCHLKYPCKSYIFKIYQKHQFFVVK